MEDPALKTNADLVISIFASFGGLLYMNTIFEHTELESLIGKSNFPTIIIFVHSMLIAAAYVYYSLAKYNSSIQNREIEKEIMKSDIFVRKKEIELLTMQENHAEALNILADTSSFETFQKEQTKLTIDIIKKRRLLNNAILICSLTGFLNISALLGFFLYHLYLEKAA